MEWNKCKLSGAELEKKRREYIDAAMNMSRRAVCVNEPPAEAVEEPFETELPAEECAGEAFPEPEQMQEPEEIPVPEAHDPEKITFGVFDMQQLTEAVKNGEMDGDKLREAAEILEEMSGKTKLMQELAEKSSGKQAEKQSCGSCPQRAGQSGKNG